MANRVQGSTGSFNARWRREPGGGNTDQPEADNLRGSAQNADREKLNDERGVKPLPDSGSRDAGRTGKSSTRMGKGPLLYSGPRNQPRTISRLEIMPKRELRTCPISRDASPTYVTAAVKTMTNRARSVVAGVVSGAGQVCRCFKHRALMRVPQLGPGIAWTHCLWPKNRRLGVASARQLKRRVRAYGWCRAQMHTRKRRRDLPVSMMSAGRWFESTGPF